MLIRCPECDKEISDKAEICIGCGYPIKEYVQENKENEEPKKCPYCNSFDIDKDYYCNDCGMNTLVRKNIEKETQNEVLEIENKVLENEFNGIYKYDILGKKKEVYCLRCNSENCSHYKVDRIIPGKTKTRYTANLNLLRPFTLVNKKEKVVRREMVVTENKFMCDKCGYIFN